MNKPSARLTGASERRAIDIVNASLAERPEELGAERLRAGLERDEDALRLDLDAARKERPGAEAAREQLR